MTFCSELLRWPTRRRIQPLLSPLHSTAILAQKTNDLRRLNQDHHGTDSSCLVGHLAWKTFASIFWTMRSQAWNCRQRSDTVYLNYCCSHQIIKCARGSMILIWREAGETRPHKRNRWRVKHWNTWPYHWTPGRLYDLILPYATTKRMTIHHCCPSTTNVRQCNSCARQHQKTSNATTPWLLPIRCLTTVYFCLSTPTNEQLYGTFASRNKHRTTARHCWLRTRKHERQYRTFARLKQKTNDCTTLLLHYTKKQNDDTTLLLINIKNHTTVQRLCSSQAKNERQYNTFVQVKQKS